MAQIPDFKLVRDAKDPVVNQSMPQFYVFDLNGDKIPDRIEINQGEGGVGFQVKWGKFTKIDDAVATPGQELFFGNIPATAVLSYSEKQSLWSIKPKTDARIVNFELADLNGDGDTDISFTLSQSVVGNSDPVRGAFLLMNQAIPDPVIYSMGEQDKKVKPAKKPVPQQDLPAGGVPG